ncbi:methyltransferase [Pseudoxanthobacter sp.]|uniref:tRNA1(Val) (adenine(37)-N6)-methyltransferase n=1 Tax=Pseudoxanthobacter sp. TaxID=1925742 RepID=UPI002FE1ED05
MGETGTTCDSFLGGRICALQPARGPHRSGHDAVLLAAALPADFTGTAFDLGAGSGVAGFALAARCPGLQVVLAERDPAALALARAGLALPENAAFAGRVRAIEADVTAPAARRAAAGLVAGSADAVVMNPPFHRAGAVRASPDAARAGAHVLAPEGLEPWLRTAAGLLRPGGVVAVIFPAAGLGPLLAALGGRFGAVAVLPVQPRAEAQAIRVVVQAIAGSRGPLALLPPLVLHAGAGPQPSPAAAAVLRDGARLPGLPVVAPPRRRTAPAAALPPGGPETPAARQEGPRDAASPAGG